MAESVMLCKRDDIDSGEARSFEVKGQRVALVRIEDRFYAVQDRCSHQDFALSIGEVYEDEAEIECPKHGSSFDLITGEPRSLPATKPIRVYELELVDDEVRVLI